MKCYLCNNNEADSKEHIIPNSIGGTIKPKILCDTCAKKYGPSNEAALAKSLLFFTNKIGHTRDRGNIPDLECEVDGVAVKMTAGSNEVNGCHLKDYEKKDNAYRYTMVAIGESGEKQLKKKQMEMITAIGKKNKWDEDKINEELAKIEGKIESTIKTIEHPLVKVSLSFGGKDVYLSYLKTATNFYILKGYDRSHIVEAIRIITEQNDDVLKVANLYFPEDFFPTDSIYHTIYLRGDVKNKKLVCLISYYNVSQVLLILNNNYEGECFEETYCYDIWNEVEAKFCKTLEINQSIVEWVFGRSEDYLLKTREQMLKMADTFMKHFVVKSDFADTTGKMLIDIFMNAIPTLARQPNFIEQKDFVEEISALIPLNLKGLERFKRENILECLSLTKEILYQEYLGQKTKEILFAITLQEAPAIVIMEMRKNNMNPRQIDWEIVKSNLLQNLQAIKTNNEDINKCIPKVLEHILQNMDSIITTIKSSIGL